MDRQTISRRIEELGRTITQDYQQETPVLLGVLKGCVVFMADLMRRIDLPVEIEFISAASYRQGSRQEEDLFIGGGSAISLKGRHVLIVEGIVDSGRTITTLLAELKDMEPASVEVVTLLDKPASHRSKLDIKYKGFSIGNEFVIGFGLDNTQMYRNLPFIGRLVENR